MKGMAGVMERIDHVAGLDDRRPLYTRKASDPDAVLLAKLRRGDTGAAEALVAAYGDRVYRLAVRITGNASDAEEETILGAAISELPTDYRTAFVLHDVEGLSNLDIAQTLQVTVTAIKSRVHRARLFLRRRLADYVGVGFNAA